MERGTVPLSRVFSKMREDYDFFDFIDGRLLGLASPVDRLDVNSLSGAMLCIAPSLLLSCGHLLSERWSPRHD